MGMHSGISLVFRVSTALLPGAFALLMPDAALEGHMALAGGAASMLLPLGLRPYGQEGAESGQDELLNLYAVLEGCPVGAAVVAHGRLCFANAVFMGTVPLAAGAEGVRVVFDNAPSGAEQTDRHGRNATLYWNAADGNAYRMKLVARMAPYRGEDTFFLWMTGLTDDATLSAAQPLPSALPPPPLEPAPASPLNVPHGRELATEKKHIEKTPSPPPADGMPSAKPKGRILLAEDNEINQEIAIELLEHVGVEVTVASNGQEAVDLFLERDFDLILMDIQMPLMDGADATRAIRTSGKAGADAIPILAMTAHAMSSDREKSLNAGMNDHLTKPIDPQALYAALDVWLPESVRPLAKEPADMPEPSAFPPSAVSATQAAPTEMKPQDILFSLQGLDAQAGLSNVAGNRELYLRLLDRFANNYRNSSAELRDALQRMKYDASAHEEAVRLAHTAKGVAANLGASALAAVAAELESAIKKNNVREDMLARYEMLLREALDSIEALPKLDDVYVGQKAISDSDKKRITAVLDVLPNLMQTDWYSAQQRLLALAPVVQDTAVSAHFREITMALEEFDSESVAEKGKSLLAAI